MTQRDARSPSYPQMGLSRCLDLLRRLYEGIHKGAVGNTEAQQIMGFAVKSGSGLAALSALKKFNLIEGRDPQIRITDLGFRVLEPMDNRERQAAIRDAALSPPIFAEMLSAFGGKLPADAVIRAKLVREHGFTSAGAESFIRSLRETVSLVQTEDLTDRPETTSADGPSEPSARSGEQTTAQIRATAPGVGPLSAADMDHLPGPGMTRAAFPLAEGSVYLTFPSELSAEGYAELAEYLQIFLRRAERLKRQ